MIVIIIDDWDEVEGVPGAAAGSWHAARETAGARDFDSEPGEEHEDEEQDRGNRRDLLSCI
jgi:hypothetical protein